jgi:hypothetical protein
VREHLYYRCANNHPGPEHPTVRWPAADLEQAVLDDLGSMRFGSPEIASWFRTELQAAVDDLTSFQRRQAASLAKRKTELVAMQDRLLSAYLTGTVNESAYKNKCGQLRDEIATTDESMAGLDHLAPDRGKTAMAIFDWAQRAGDYWRGSNTAVRRAILDAVCLNRTLSDVSLVTTKRKPFDVLAERPDLKNSRGDWI